MKSIVFKILVLLLSGSFAHASDESVIIGDVAMPKVESSEAFKQVRKKLGRWEGQMTQALTGKVFDVSYEWKLTSGGNTITERLVEDGVEMLTTYSDKNGELVIKHYCALGTEPIFKVSSVSEETLEIRLDQDASDLHAEHESFVTKMKWKMWESDPDKMLFTNTVMLDGEPTSNSAIIKRVQ